MRPVRALVIVVGTLLAAAPAAAEVVAGHPDESIQQAYGPIQPNTTYTGAFDDSNYDDVDYLAFSVSRAGQSLDFTVQNTTQACNDPNQAACPVYATLMDSTDHQVGGDTSSAGTIATAGDTETIAWTFAQPGTYYLLMESNGDEAPGSPSYAVSYAVPAVPAPPLVRSLTVAPRQRGRAVTASIVLGQQAARIRATLLGRVRGGRQRLVAAPTWTNLAAGTHRLQIRLPALWKAMLKHTRRLSLTLRLVITGASGPPVSYTRPVTFTR